MSTPIGVIKKFIKTLVETKSTGTAAVDEAMKAVGAVSCKVFKEKFSSARSSLGTQDFLEQVCSVRINNTDTGGKKNKTPKSIVPESAKAVELTAAEYKSFTKNGLTFKVNYNEQTDSSVGEKFGYSGKTYLAKQKLVVRVLYNLVNTRIARPH